MATEFRLYGPPGTGKTTWVARQIQHALYKYEAESIYAVSFTRAGAVELAGRDTGLPPGNVGTIHSICFRAMDRQPIMEADKDLLKEWNDRNGNTWPVLLHRRSLDEQPHNSMADPLLVWNRERAMLTGRKNPPEFADRWERFKADHNAIDFTDMLLRAPEYIPASVLLVDEAQDMTPLQWRIVRRWGEHAEVFIVAGDEDQAIYEWMGATPDHMLSPLPPDQIKRLHQSYRLPRAVHAFVDRWIKRLGPRRAEKPYAPREAEGVVHRRPFSFADPQRMLSDIMESAGTSMVLASCAYMLRPFIDHLRAQGVIYHNPYRRERGDWNPLGSGATARRLLAFLKCGEALANDDRTALDDPAPWAAWMDMLKADGALTRGAKQAVKTHEGPIPPATLFQWLTPETAKAAVNQDLKWLAEHMTATARKESAYPIAILSKHGATALTDKPKVIIGTIHSVKGGEADQVYLSPDLSLAAFRDSEQKGQRGWDALRRLMYVGATRARERLVLCQAAGKFSVTW